MSQQSRVGRARIYVSFADEDRVRAMELVRWLNDSGWQVAADDRHAFAPGEEWSPSGRLEACDVMLCVITPGWLVSVFCHREFAYCAKRGKFVLPVICELPDLGVLPEVLRALPRVDLTQNRLVDYLALKTTLSQAGSRIGRVGIVVNEPEPAGRLAVRPSNLRVIGLLLAAVMLGTIVTFWFWTRN
jgi:hypothetical protein